MPTPENTTTLEIDGAQITVETALLFRAWFEKSFSAGHAKSPIGTAVASFPEPRAGERYVGSITEPDGRVRQIYLLSGDVSKNWGDSMEWAKSIGGDLPDRVEQALLHAYLPDEFQKEAYWSNTQHAAYSDSAWSQDFVYGYQDYLSKTDKLRARAVRREFSNSVI